MALRGRDNFERGRDVIVKVLVIRHAERTEDEVVNGKPVKFGMLTERGREDSKRFGQDLRSRFPDFDLMRVWGSERVRTQDTARGIEEGFSGHEARRAAVNYRLTAEHMIPDGTEEGKRLWEAFLSLKKENGQIDFNSPAFETERGRLVEKLIAAPMAAMIEHARKVAARSPNGSRKLEIYACHDITIGLLLHYVAAPGEMDKFGGNPNVPFLGNVSIDIRTDGSGVESISAEFLGKEIKIDMDRLGRLNDFYRLRTAARA